MAGFSVQGTGLQAIVRVLEAVAHNRERSSAFLAANSSDERMPFFCNSASSSIFAKRSVSWAAADNHSGLLFSASNIIGKIGYPSAPPEERGPELTG